MAVVVIAAGGRGPRVGNQRAGDPLGKRMPTSAMSGSTVAGQEFEQPVDVVGYISTTLLCRDAVKVDHLPDARSQVEQKG